MIPNKYLISFILNSLQSLSFKLLLIIVILLPLYIPLRFGFPSLISIIPILIYLMALMAFFFSIVKDLKKVFTTTQDTYMFIFSFYVLIHIILFNSSGLLQWIRMYFFPIIFYFISSLNITKNKHPGYLILAILVGALYSSIDYFYQFIHQNVLRLGHVNYMSKYLIYIDNKGDSISNIGDGITQLLRLFGNFGYNHMTALYIGLGVVICIIIIKEKIIKNKTLKIFTYLILFFTSSVLLMTLARTSIFITLLCILFIFRNKLSILFSLAGFLFGTLIIYSQFNSLIKIALSFILSKERYINFFNFILYQDEIKEYFFQIKTLPISLFSGVGFSEGIGNNDLYLFELLSQLGLIGVVLMCFIVFELFNQIRKIKEKQKSIALLFFYLVIMILLSSAHSSALKYVQMTPFLFIFIGAINAIYKQSYSQYNK